MLGSIEAHPTAFVVVAHRGPAQLGRLARSLLVPGATVHLHVDRRTKTSVYDAIRRALPDYAALDLLPRIRTAWSSWGPVEATLRALARVLSASPPPEHIVLMSGQCYPLRRVPAVQEFLAEHRGRSFVAHVPMPSDIFGADGGMSRLRLWHTPIGRRRCRLPFPRRYPGDLVPYGGSAFMILDRESARAVLDFTRARPDVARFHRHVWIPDEHYIPTVLVNSSRRDAVINENLWHIEWPATSSTHPTTFRIEDFDRLAAAARNGSQAGGNARAKLFARKFDADADPRLVDRIDAELLLRA